MSRTERLTERAITFAIAEPNEDPAVARLAFLAQSDHAALDAAIGACLARGDRTLYTRWRAIGFLARGCRGPANARSASPCHHRAQQRRQASGLEELPRP